MTSREEFLQLLHQTPPSLAAAALLAVQILKQDTEAAKQSTRQALATLDSFRALARSNGVGDNASTLAAYIGDELGFTGNSLNYYAPENSDLGHVLSARVGIPITLALLYIDLGRESGMDVRGIGFPGHFLVGHYNSKDKDKDASEIDLIDPFTNELVNRSGCVERVLAQLPKGTPAPAQEEIDAWFRPVTPTAILLRVLENLKQIYLRNQSPHAGLSALELQLLIAPEQTELRAQHAQLEALAPGSAHPTTVH